MDLYNITGTLNTALIMASLYGVLSQLKTVWRRKRVRDNQVPATALLSLNQFTVSFLAYLAFFIYGYSITPFNHYIVWPRMCASILVLIIIFEIFVDRKSLAAKISLYSAICCFLLALLGLLIGDTIADEGKTLSTSLILVVSLLIAQGYFHQIRLILSSGHTGAVDLKMSQFILMMDISTIAFAISMGLKTSWPLLILAITSGVTKVIIMYLFKWVITSPLAAKRRVAWEINTKK